VLRPSRRPNVLLRRFRFRCRFRLGGSRGSGSESFGDKRSRPLQIVVSNKNADTQVRVSPATLYDGFDAVGLQHSLDIVGIQFGVCG